MIEMEYIITITSTITYLFEALSTQLPISINFDLLNQILQDSNEDQVNSKEYLISQSGGIPEIKGLVSEYEPETLIITVNGFGRKQITTIDKIIDSYIFSFGSGAHFRKDNESLTLFKRMLE